MSLLIIAPPLGTFSRGLKVLLLTSLTLNATGWKGRVGREKELERKVCEKEESV